MRALILEIEAGQAVVMKNNGQFTKVPAKPGWQTGDVVPLAANKSTPFKVWVALAACLVLMAGLAFSGYILYSTQVTLVSIDVNPSIELSLNRFDRVIAAKGLNTEGEQIVNEVPVSGLSYTQALNAMMEDTALNDYISANAVLVFAVQSGDATRQNRLLASLEKTAGAAVLARHQDAIIEYLPVDEKAVEDAHCHGMSAGKYTLVQELAGLVPGLDVDAYSHHSIAEIQGEIATHQHRGMECQNHSNGQNSGQGRHRPQNGPAGQGAD